MILKLCVSSENMKLSLHMCEQSRKTLIINRINVSINVLKPERAVKLLMNKQDILEDLHDGCGDL